VKYEFPPFRPPSEAGSYLLRVVRGCNWNKCAFCGMYKGMRFHQRPKREILSDIDRISKIFGYSTTAFLADSNPLIHRDITEIISYLIKSYPWIERITAYARIKTIAAMPKTKLKELHESGLTRIHMGLESGDEEVLKLVNKGISPEDAIKACKKASRYFEVSYYVITGLAGVRKSVDHAKNTAKVLNFAKPNFVRVRNLIILDGTPIKNMVGREIVPLNAKQQLLELRTLIENINFKTYFTCDHVSNYVFSEHGPIFHGVSGYLPEYKDEMVCQIDDALRTIETLESSGCRIFTGNDMYKLGIISL